MQSTSDRHSKEPLLAVPSVTEQSATDVTQYTNSLSAYSSRAPHAQGPISEWKLMRDFCK